MLKPQQTGTDRRSPESDQSAPIVQHAVRGGTFVEPQLPPLVPGTPQPSVAVVIPVFNGEDFIAEAIRSALDQTLPANEIIVVDDGSTDGTVEVLKQFGSSIQLIRQKNKGNAAARNTGVLSANSDWIAVLDADDIWEPHKLETQLEHVGSADLIYTNVRNFGETGYVNEVTFPAGSMPAGDVLERLLRDNFIPHSTVLIRKSVIEAVGGYDESLLSCCDWDLWLRLALQGTRVHAIEEPLIRYRWRSNSTSKQYALSCRNRVRVLTRAFDAMPATKENHRLRKECFAAIWRTSAWFVQSADEWRALRWYLRSLRYEPFSRRSWLEVFRIVAHQFGISRSLFRTKSKPASDHADSTPTPASDSDALLAAIEPHIHAGTVGGEPFLTGK